MPTFKLDGKAVDFRPGEMIIEAAARAGVPIPYYCYHPDMSQPANCRMCLVEMVGAPKLVTACSWPVNEKMEILTGSDRVKAARNNVMEFLLINHPLDCPICDQAGECKLQQYSYLFGQPASSMEEEKVHLDKRKILGPHVVLDQERCISCTRCVRFTQEVTGTGELTMINRTSFQTVDIQAGKELDNAYSGCVVDMCPVGALTNRDFRFSARVWYLQSTPSACTLCSRGCNVSVDWRGERAKLPEVKRLRARRNPGVNSSWMCDEGRFGHERIATRPRPTKAHSPDAPTGGDAYAALDHAVAAAARILRQHAGEQGWLGVLASGCETNEELAALARLARAADPQAALVVPATKDEAEDALLRRTDKTANQQGARRLGWEGDVAKLSARRVLVVVDGDLRPDGGLQAEGLKALAKGATGIALAAHERPWLKACQVLLPLANAFEKDGTIVNFEGTIQRLNRVIAPPAHCRPAERHAADLALAAGLGEQAADAASWLAELCAAKGAFAGLEPDRLTQWGARLPAAHGGAVTYLEDPLPMFSASPQSYAEGEYVAFLPTTTPPPAVHVAAGAPSRIRTYAGGEGRDEPGSAGGQP